VYSNPLPHVLILTAIVVGVATLALGLALVVRIREAYDSIEEEDILAADELADAQVIAAENQRTSRASA
jgi:multicomponent Na+:H+ antiporter subunit C